MAEEQVERRLAAILAADVVGYTRLTEQDEAGTLAALRARRKNVLEPLIARHRGRIVKVMGDGVLVEFASAVNAVACGLDLQKHMATANEGLADDRRIVLRVGINLGDVIVEDGDLYGDGVNIAARLESIAEPGEICLSGTAYDQVKNKVDTGFEDLGARRLKNIVEPVRVYRVTGTPRTTAAAPGVMEKPSMAVLPFANLSGDAAQEYFSDGITEDIIIELSRFRQLNVLARNASFRYRGQVVDVVDAGRELGAQYLLKGSVRRVGDRIRITAQLVDTRSGHQLWAERFDRDQEDLFAVQDQVVRTIVATLVGRLQAADADQAMRKPPASLAAYECVLRGHALPVGEPAAAAEARRLFERAIELDPGYARAHGMLAHTHASEWFRDMSEADRTLDRAFDLAKRAVALGENDANCQGVLGMIHLYRQSHELAEHHCRMALELNPNNPPLVAGLGYLHVFAGRPVEGLDCLREAKRLDPFFEPSWYWPYVGMAHFVARQHDEAIAALDRTRTMPFWGAAYLTAACALADRTERARQHAAEVMRLLPDFSLSRFAAKEPYAISADRQHLVDGLRRAGLPG